MSDSVLDRIRQNRKRASVPPRNDTLITQAQFSEASSENASTDQPLETIESAPAKTAPPSSPSAPIAATQTGSTLDELKAELVNIPETRRHSAIVLQKDLDQELTRFCKEQGITVEVFLEAAWLQAVANSELMDTVLTEARRRYRDRKRAGQIRRLITMLEGQ